MNLRIASLITVACAACGSGSSAPPPQPPAPPPPASPVSAGPALAPGQHSIYAEDLDRTADPCTDFYAFANGTWRKQNPIPASMQKWSRRWKSGEDSKDLLKNILDEVAARKDWPAHGAEQLIGDFYAGCMDQAQADARGIAPLKPLLAEIDRLRSKADLGKLITHLHAIGIDAPFGVGGLSDLHTPTEVITWIGAGGLGMPDRDYYVKPEPRFAEARDKYAAHVARMFELAGRKPAEAKRAAATVMTVETSLARAALDNIALRDPAATDHATTPPDLQKLTPSFDWTAYFKAFKLAPQIVNVTEPAFLTEVERQLRATAIADWKIYFTWQVLHEAASSLAQPMVDEDFAFFGKYLEGSTENKPRWKRCVEATDKLLGEALGQKYVEKYFPPAAKARVQQQVANILAAMHDTIEKLDWMSAATKQRAFEKLATFNPKIGYPDKWKDYRTVTVRRDAYWESRLSARAWNVDDDRAQIGKPVDRGRWGLTPPTSDAYYNPSLNEIVFPAGILQPPLFSMDAVDAVNYGAIGQIIGHEISHGFDDQGAQFDAQGKLDNWWSKDDLAQFTQRGQCVADQFEHYFIEPTIHHQGKLVLGESIGDVGGINLTYRAFQKAKQQTPAPTVGGLSPDQQFFIAFGQYRGDEMRPEYQRLMVQHDPHPVSKYRVIGPLSNSLDFRRAFNCRAGQPMVRDGANRCSVW